MRFLVTLCVFALCSAVAFADDELYRGADGYPPSDGSSSKESGEAADIPEGVVADPPDSLGVTEDPVPPISIAIEDAPKPKPPLGHVRVGGSFGFSMSSNFIFLDVSPAVSYLIRKRVEPGARFIYQYSKDRLPGPDIRGNTIGGSLFLRAFVIGTLFAEVEGLLLNTGFKQSGFSTPRETFGNVLLGGGYMIPLGGSAFAGLSIKVNLIRNALYPETRPFISVGAGAQF